MQRLHYTLVRHAKIPLEHVFSDSNKSRQAFYWQWTFTASLVQQLHMAQWPQSNSILQTLISQGTKMTSKITFHPELLAESTSLNADRWWSLCNARGKDRLCADAKDFVHSSLPIPSLIFIIFIKLYTMCCSRMAVHSQRISTKSIPCRPAAYV